MNGIAFYLKKRRLFASIVVLAAVLLFIGTGVYAAPVVLESGIPGVGTGGAQGAELPSLATYINYLYIFVLSFVGIAGFISLVIWGTVWVGSAVVDNKTRAMEGIKNTLIGIGIALTAFIMLYTINPDLTIIKVPTIGAITLTPQAGNCYQYSASTCPLSMGCELGIINGMTSCFKKGDSVNGCCLYRPFTGDFAGNYKECANGATYVSCTADSYKGSFYPGRTCAEKKLYKNNWIIDANAVGKYCTY
ncbi:hypothetical protein HY839_01785 [Candidatus Azambacteria bacterium]|nr:hypothetical protein [Candidatus Azambacteria bacterium]